MSDDHSGRRIFDSAGAAIFSQLTRVGVTFATHLLLRRLLTPGQWGLWHWSEPIFLILGAVRDLGLPVHALRVRPRPYGNLLAVEAAWGGALVVLTQFAAPLLAGGYHEPNPDVVPVLRALSLFILFDGLARVARTWFEAELALRRTVVPELVRNFVYSATALTLASLGYGTWSMVVAYVVAAAVFAAVLWSRAWGRIPLHWAKGETRTLIRSSLPLAGIWLLVLLTTYVDPFIIGARYPGEVVATYGFAFYIAFLVNQIMLEPIGRVLYPAVVDLRHQPRKLFATYRLAALLLLALEVPAALFVFVNAELVLLILGGGQWAGSAVYLRVLCFAPLMDPFTLFGGDVLMARHEERTWIGASLTTLVWFAGAGLVATATIGPRGMALVHLLPFGMLLIARGLHRIAPSEFLALLRDLAFVYLIPVLPFTLVWLLLARSDAGTGLYVRAAACLPILGLVGALYWRRFGGEFVSFFRGESEG